MLKLRVKPTLTTYEPTTLTIPDELLAMLSEEAKKMVIDTSTDDDQRFKALIEELHIARKLSLRKLSKLINVPRATLWCWTKRLSVQPRDRTAALQLANTKYIKSGFYGDEVEKLKLWYMVHTDGSVQRARQQVLITLFTPDPYLAFLFKELFGRYGHVGVAPQRDGHGQCKWQLWVYLLLKSFIWLIKKCVPASIDNDNLYDVLSIAIDTEGAVSAYKHTRRRDTVFKIVFYNEKDFLIKPLQQALTQLGYELSLSKVPKGRETTFGALNNDYHYFMIRSKDNVKRLLECIKPSLFHKRLKAYLIRRALSLERSVYWEDVEPIYSEINALKKKMFTESKDVAKALHAEWCALKEQWKSGEISWREYEAKREKLKARAWEALEALKAKYDALFGEIEKRIESRFRA